MIRGGLVSSICYQTLALDENATKGSATLTLMSTDVERVCGFFTKSHELWANLIEVAIAIWLLQRQPGKPGSSIQLSYQRLDQQIP
jgi:hypothetical protein